MSLYATTYAKDPAQNWECRIDSDAEAGNMPGAYLSTGRCGFPGTIYHGQVHGCTAPTWIA